MNNPAQQPILRVRKPEYDSYGIKGNPFPIAGLSSVHAPYPLIDGKMDDEVHEFVSQTLQSEEYCGMAILGEFGSGKTYALRYIETLLETIQQQPDAEEVMAIYVERPRATVQALVSDIAERIGRVRICNILLEIVLTDLAAILHSEDPKHVNRIASAKKAFKRENPADLFRNEDPFSALTATDAILNPAGTIDALRAGGTKPQFLSEFATESIATLLSPSPRRLQELAGHFADMILCDDTNSAHLWNCFLSGKLMQKEKVVAEISGQQIWCAVRHVLNRAGYRMIYVLIDELEESEYQNTKQNILRGFLADLRDLIDSNLNGFALVVASKVGAWDVYKGVNPAFPQRFSRVVHLPPNSFSDLKRMISERLRLVRKENWEGSEIAPFTDAAIKRLEKESKGNTRVAVQACHILLWHVANLREQTITDHMVATLNEISRAFYASRSGL
jgi:hypothetical protein